MNGSLQDIIETSDESLDDEEINNAKEKEKSNAQLADALSKVLRMSKRKKGKSIVLSKATLYESRSRATVKKKYDFEIEPNPNSGFDEKKENVVSEGEEVKPSRENSKKLVLKRKEKINRGRLKPSPLDREKEKPLIRIATKGVVQLFNAIRQQQSNISKEINKPGVTEGKKEKILKSIDKKIFLDVLKGNKLSNSDKNSQALENMTEEIKEEVEESEPSWKVLRDDFMMDAKLKDWDKKEMEEVE